MYFKYTDKNRWKTGHKVLYHVSINQNKIGIAMLFNYEFWWNVKMRFKRMPSATYLGYHSIICHLLIFFLPHYLF